MAKYELHKAPPPQVTNARERKHFPEDLLTLLKENPGDWAIGSSGKNTAQANYWRKQLRPLGFTITTRKTEDGYDHWITYDGSGDEEIEGA